MRSALCALGLIVAISCGGAKPRPDGAGEREAWDVTARIPANTPYVFVTLEPFPEEVRAKMNEMFTQQAQTGWAAIEQLLVQNQGAAAKALRAVIQEFKTQPLGQWWESAGFARSTRFAIYGLSLWPVAVFEVADPAAVTQLVQRTLTTAGVSAQATPQGAWTTWQLPLGGEGTLLLALNQHEAVISAMPTETLTKALPFVLGTRRPERSLADEHAIDALRQQHGFASYLTGLIDLKSALTILTGRATGTIRELSDRLAVPELVGCAADLDRLASLVPRIAMGYHHFDVNGFDASVVLEMPPAVVSALSKLATTAPGVTWPPPAGPSLGTAGMAVDVGSAISVMRDASEAIQARPFTCPSLAPLNQLGAALRSMASTPLPPILTAMRGWSLAIDHISTNPPGATGHLLAVSDQMETLPIWLGGIPGMTDVSLAPDGTPTALPIADLGIPWASAAHGALRGDRLVVAFGGDSAGRIAAQLSAPQPQRSPLFVMSYNVPELFKLLPQLPPNSGAVALKRVSAAAAVVEQGLEMKFEGRW